MPTPKPQPEPAPAPAPAADAALEAGAAPEEERAIEALLERAVAPEQVRRPAPAPAPPALRTARVAAMTSAGALIVWRGGGDPIPAVLDAGVDRALVARAFEHGDAVLVEVDAEGPARPAVAPPPVVVGVVQTRIPARLEVTGETVVIEAQREVLLRAGRAALRLREDGDVELVGSRILSMSRGLFRIVGRVLRLN